jgi:hypothetical protein
MKKKYLPLYYKWSETGRLPYDGLCICFGKDKLFRLLRPTEEIPLYWGYQGGDVVDYWTIERHYAFNPLRQNIVLFMAAKKKWPKELWFTKKPHTGNRINKKQKLSYYRNSVL